MNLLAEIGAHLTGIELLRAMQENDRRPGIAQTLDFRLVEVENGRVVLEGTPDGRVLNPLGIVHGGYAATLLDTACGYAALSTLVAGRQFMTLELKVAYHRPMTNRTGPMRVEGRIVTLGRRVAFTEGTMSDAAGRVYATATSTLLITEQDT